MRIENGGSNNQSMTVNTSRKVKPQTQAEDVRPSETYKSLADKPKAELTLDERQWINLIERANKALSGGNRSFEFSIHEATKEIMIKVIDTDTNKVIREIPNEKILDMVAKMWELAGIFVDERR